MEPYQPHSHFRQYGHRFIRYHIKDNTTCQTSRELLAESNRRAARSLAEDFAEYILKPIYVRVAFYVGLFLGIMDDIMYTYDWGKFNSHNPDYLRYDRQQYPRYTKGWDRPTRPIFSGSIPDSLHDHYVWLCQDILLSSHKLPTQWQFMDVMS